MQQVLTDIQKVFVELKIVWKDFTNCGTRHIQNPITKEITLDQIEYTQNLRQIAHPELKTAKNDSFCTPPLHQLYIVSTHWFSTVPFRATTPSRSIFTLSD